MADLTRGLPEDLLTSRSHGGWSVKENAGHLLDLEALWRARTEQFLVGAATLAAADPENRKTHEVNHNTRSLDDILDKFRAARLEWLAELDGLTPDDFAKVSFHPRLRVAIRLVDHLVFVAEHDDHHLAQIWELSQMAPNGPVGSRAV